MWPRPTISESCQCEAGRIRSHVAFFVSGRARKPGPGGRCGRCWGSWISKWPWSTPCPSHPDSPSPLPCTLHSLLVSVRILFLFMLFPDGPPWRQVWPELGLDTSLCHFLQCLWGPPYMTLSNFDFRTQSGGGGWMRNVALMAMVARPVGLSPCLSLTWSAGSWSRVFWHPMGSSKGDVGVHHLLGLFWTLIFTLLGKHLAGVSGNLWISPDPCSAPEARKVEPGSWSFNQQAHPIFGHVRDSQCWW